MTDDQPIRILIVDDEPVVRMTLETALEDGDWKVSAVENAEDALAHIAAEPVELMLTDKNLPGMDGVELVRRVKADHPSIICVMITGYASVDSALDTMNIGIEAYLEKPFDDIFAVVDQVTDLAKLARLRRSGSLGRLGESISSLRQATERLQQASQKSTDAHGLAVLVAVEEVAVRNAVEKTLSEPHDTIDLANDFSSVDKTIHSRSLDLVILEDTMLAGDPLTVLEKINTTTPDTAIVCIMASPSLQFITAAFKFGVVSILEKGLSQADVEKRLSSIARRLR